MATDEEKAERLQRFEQRAEIPMLVLSLLTIPIVLLPVIEDLSTRSLWSVAGLTVFIWLTFVAEYATRVYLSPNRWQTVKTHKLDLAIAVAGFFPVLRLARLARLVYAGTAAFRVIRSIQRVLGRPGFDTMLFTVTGFIFAGGFFVTLAEHDQPGGTIDGFFDGIWWAFVTCTTVGYGDEFPITTSGRVIAILLMLVGISGLSIVTANIAAQFVASETEDETARLETRLARIEEKLDSIHAQLHE